MRGRGCAGGGGHVCQGGMCGGGGMHGRGHAWQGACMTGGGMAGGGMRGRYYKILSMSGRYASYWNAFFLALFFGKWMGAVCIYVSSHTATHADPNM